MSAMCASLDDSERDALRVDDEVVMAGMDRGICSTGATPPPPRACTMTHDELRIHLAASVAASRPAALRVDPS